MKQMITAAVGVLLLTVTAGAQHKMEMSDGEFAHMMAMHHQHGIEMTKLEESQGQSTEVKALAAKIRKGQERDLPKLKAFDKQSPKPSAMMAEHQKMMDKEHTGMMAKMKGAKGAAMDKMFVEMMIKHHESGLEMIKQTTFKDGALKEMADKMAEEHRVEITELQQVK